MSVYKEGYSIVNQILNNQIPIFNDACDIGYPVRKGDPTWYQIKQLKHMYHELGVDKLNRGKEGGYFEIVLIDEWAVSDKRKSVAEAMDKYRIIYSKMFNWNSFTVNPQFKGCDGFVTIEQIS